MLYAGFATVDITPQGKMQLIGQFHKRVADHANDPLRATVLAVGDDPADPVYWVSLDLLQIPRVATEALRDACEKAIPGFDRSRFIASCIHNHTGPYLTSSSGGWGPSYAVVTADDEISPEDYRDNFLAPRVAEACRAAKADMKPVGVSSILGHAVIGHCRRVMYRDGSEAMYGTTDTYNFDRLECAADGGIEWIFFYGENETLRGVVMNVACPAQVLEGKSYYTADYVGYFRKVLWEQLGRELPVIATIADAGNLSPRDLVRRGRGEPNMREIEGAEEIADRLLTCFNTVYPKSKKNVDYAAPFACAYQDLPLPRRTVSLAEIASADAQWNALLAKHDGDPMAFTQSERSGIYRAAGIRYRAAAQEQCSLYDCPVHALRIGETAVVTNPFELFVEYGQRTVARSKAAHTMTVQLTDDTGDYLPTPQAIAGGSYSTFAASNTASPEGGELLTETSIRMINRMF